MTGDDWMFVVIAINDVWISHDELRFMILKIVVMIKMIKVMMMMMMTMVMMIIVVVVNVIVNDHAEWYMMVMTIIYVLFDAND